MATITLGLEVCVETPPDVLHGARFGLLLNQASVDRQLRYAHDALQQRFPGQLAALFGPQHGLWTEQQDDMIETPHGLHPRLQVPVHSLYSETRTPTPAMLDGLDCLVIDLQDVGTRVYTYIWTMLLCLQACAEHDVAVLVLDRPNPLGGTLVEGPRLRGDLRSFVGLRRIPMRHGLTIGELARVFNRDVGADLHVVPIGGWNRTLDFGACERTWIAPSPNLPRLDAARVYPGQVLFEGTNLSEGRGTTAPFEQCGAPFVDAERWIEALTPHELPGVHLRPVRFEPTSGKWAATSCGGVFLHVTEPEHFQPYRTSVALLATARRLWPDRFGWRAPGYEYDATHPPIDLLAGTPMLRAQLDAGADVAAVRALAAIDADDWWREVGDALLYGPRPARTCSRRA